MEKQKRGAAKGRRLSRTALKKKESAPPVVQKGGEYKHQNPSLLQEGGRRGEGFRFHRFTRKGRGRKANLTSGKDEAADSQKGQSFPLDRENKKKKKKKKKEKKKKRKKKKKKTKKKKKKKKPFLFEFIEVGVMASRRFLWD